MRCLNTFLLILTAAFSISGSVPKEPVRVLVITGGHDFKVTEFNQMFDSFGSNINFQIAELPGAYDMFKPENRDKYDVLVFYHMWQTITQAQAEDLTDCIRSGKPLVALHHSICAYDDWPEYWNIIGGKYFHKPTNFNGNEYAACSYIHDLHFTVKIAKKKHPVTKGVKDFQIFDETYKGYYVADGIDPLLTTDEPSSNHLIGWAKKYGKSRIVVLQSGHDVPTFENQNFRMLLRNAIYWVFDK